MDSLDISNPAPMAGWLMFLLYLLAICVPVAIGAVWYAMTHHRNKKRRRKRHHHSSRQRRISLAETGGLPPPRDPNQPPPGP